jgi:type IV pilus assembly protein PilA
MLKIDFNKKGFTLIEVLLVIAMLAILAAVVIVAINPGKQFGEAQDAQRRNDVRSIMDAVQQYALDNAGVYPEEIPIGQDCDMEGMLICMYEVPCDEVNLDVIAEDQTYLTDIPYDPVTGGGDYTGYKIVQTADGRISVCAPGAYGEDPIVVTQ